LARRYNWAGDVIVRDTIVWNKRTVIGHNNVYIPCDIREWITSSRSEVMRQALQEIDLPTSRSSGTFDLRAWKIWKYVAEKIDYVNDQKMTGKSDWWLYPAETLALGKGDCEDSSFLLATLMAGSGISEDCIRVVLGRVLSKNGSYGHAWVVYQAESGEWCLMETTSKSVTPRLIPADPLTEDGATNRYEPKFCLNSTHLWSILPSPGSMAEYIKSREQTASPIGPSYPRPSRGDGPPSPI